MLKHDFRSTVRAHEDALLERLAEWVRIESPSHDANALDTVLDAIERRFTESGWTSERVPLDGTADALLLRTRLGDGAEDRPSTLILAHCDTVWPIGTLATMPWRRDGDVAAGPGVYDMKAGIAMTSVAVDLLRGLGAVTGDVTLLVNPDEETGSVASRPVIEAQARRHDRVMVVEPAKGDGDLVASRKGAGDFRVRFEGRSAHSGDAYADGVSALRELAAFVPWAEDLSRPDLGTTVAVTVAHAGTVSNVIPGEATAHVDLRVERPDEAERVASALPAYVPRDARVRVTFDGAIKRPPMTLDDAARRWADRIVALSDAMGIRTGVSASGGGSDANFTAALGVPTLDGLGPVGAGAHASDEHVRIGATLDRTAVLAAALTDRGA